MAKNDKTGQASASELEKDEGESTDGLVKVKKGDDVLHVHPTTVKAHAEAGWKVASE